MCNPKTRALQLTAALEANQMFRMHQLIIADSSNPAHVINCAYHWEGISRECVMLAALSQRMTGSLRDVGLASMGLVDGSPTTDLAHPTRTPSR